MEQNLHLYSTAAGFWKMHSTKQNQDNLAQMGAESM